GARRDRHRHRAERRQAGGRVLLRGQGPGRAGSRPLPPGGGDRGRRDLRAGARRRRPGARALCRRQGQLRPRHGARQAEG
nr:hypothetical protein [Tanacetum cinerariifolium]